MPSLLRDVLHDLRLAVAFMTRLPVGHVEAGAGGVARCLRVVPLVGAVIGAVLGGLYWLLVTAGAPPLAAAAIVFLASAALTGALHEDGMADVADSMGGYTRERRLEIMKDSRVGAFGALAVAGGLLVKSACLAALPGPLAVAALAACGALGRGPMAALSRWTPLARREGLAGAAGRPPLHVALTALALAAAIAALALPRPWLLPAFAATALTALAARWFCLRHIGGYTGDALGFAEQLTVIVLLLLFAMLAAADPLAAAS
ncbi:adenosylcobinamide-GDP ribazoletransferase [Camelimonas abortus]|uniref:Adenosylcobinamide-GDP ribazoletransferase n=1 Tax=Camelimonas abortus TaxID=1017184 RepID=A0ABV7LDE4_9HYPH